MQNYVCVFMKVAFQPSFYIHLMLTALICSHSGSCLTIIHFNSTEKTKLCEVWIWNQTKNASAVLFYLFKRSEGRFPNKYQSKQSGCPCISPSLCTWVKEGRFEGGGLCVSTQVQHKLVGLTKRGERWGLRQEMEITMWLKRRLRSLCWNAKVRSIMVFVLDACIESYHHATD